MFACCLPEEKMIGLQQFAALLQGSTLYNGSGFCSGTAFLKEARQGRTISLTPGGSPRWGCLPRLKSCRVMERCVAAIQAKLRS